MKACLNPAVCLAETQIRPRAWHLRSYEIEISNVSKGREKILGIENDTLRILLVQETKCGIKYFNF